MKQATTCEEALASLIACTKRRRRPKSLVEIADDLDIAIACYGDIDSVASKIGISVSMLRRFLTVHRLAPSLQHLVASRSVDSIDAVAELASLPSNLQNKLAEEFTSKKLEYDTADIRSIVRILNRTPDEPIDNVCKKVIAAKTIQIYVYEFVRRDSLGGEVNIEDRVKNVLGSDSFFGLELGAATVRLKLTEAGKKKVALLAKERRLKVSVLIQRICEGSL